MTINLVNQMGPTQAHQLLERSFAQYQADRSVVGLVRGVERGERMLDEIAAELGGRDAPILDYARLRAADLRTGDARSRGRRGCSGARPPTMRWRRCAAATSSPSPTGGAAAWPSCSSPPATSDDPRPLVLTENRWAGRISSADYSGASAPVGSMTLPKRVEHRQPRVRRDLASALRSAAAGLDVPSAQGQAQRPTDGPRRRPRTGRRCASSCAATPRTACPTARRRPGWPSGTCASSATTSRSGRRSPRRPTRWRARSTASSCCSPSVASSDGERRRPEGHRRRPAAGPDLQRKRPAGGRVPARRRVGGAGRRRAGGGVVGGALRVARRRARRTAGRRVPDRQAAPCAGRHPPVVGRAARRRAAAPDLAEPRARRGFRRRHLPLGHHRRPGRRAGRIRRRRHRFAACRRAISCGGAVRFSTWPTRCAMPPRRRSCGPPRNAQSTTFDAASSLLMQGRVSGQDQRSPVTKERR